MDEFRSQKKVLSVSVISSMSSKKSVDKLSSPIKVPVKAESKFSKNLIK